MGRTPSEYQRKRDFSRTSEPPEPSRRRRAKAGAALSFVIQKHAARRLHYDFRLELDGSLKSWAVPKGPSLDPADKRLAVHVEDHPLDYGSFEGTIPEGSYGAGDVIVWDRGTWVAEGDPQEAYAQGRLKFELKGEKLHGRWTLVRTRLSGSSDKQQWLLIKEKDDEARSAAEFDIVAEQPDSVLSTRTLDLSRKPRNARAKKPAAATETAKSGKPASKTGSATSATHDSAKKPKATRATTTQRSLATKGQTAGIRISHPERVIDGQSGATKLDVATYYARIAPWLLPVLAQRPVAILRAPSGVEGEHFFQKHLQSLAIPEIRELPVKLDPGHAPLMAFDTAGSLVGAAQMGTLELHSWNAREDRIERPDRVIFDLDPDPRLPWQAMLDAARMTLGLLDELGLRAFAKTSGGKGLHLVLPLARRQDWDAVHDFARAVCRHMAATLPTHFADKMGPKNREGRIFIDYLRNRKGASTVAAYSLRARPGLPVSVPIAIDELDGLRGADQWNYTSIFERLEGLKEDPWAGYDEVRQSLTAKMRQRLPE